MRTLVKKSTEWKGDKNNDDMICKLPQPQPSSIRNSKYNFADIPELAKVRVSISIDEVLNQDQIVLMLCNALSMYVHTKRKAGMSLP
jgi:hypothetical protein